jgi:hypothetical protein
MAGVVLEPWLAGWVMGCLTRKEVTGHTSHTLLSTPLPQGSFVWGVLYVCMYVQVGGGEHLSSEDAGRFGSVR